MGGREAFSQKLDEYFAGGHNKHDNEPSHHYGYLYDYSGQPWKTQAKVREIAAQAYSSTPAGMLGNEDCGQMSAWYVFTAMGFYPVNPVSGDYMIGSPLFQKVTLHLADGKTFVIAAAANSAKNIYIQSAELNGQPLILPVLTWKQIQAGGTLAFQYGRNTFKLGCGLASRSTPEAGVNRVGTYTAPRERHSVGVRIRAPTSSVVPLPGKRNA